VNNVRTVSDTKRSFYTIHTRPINSIYRRVVEELMVEMHLLAVNVDFQYDPIYGLGVFTSFHRLMLGYRPETDIASMFDAICQALQDDPQRYRRDAERLTAIAGQLTVKDLEQWLNQSHNIADAGDIQARIAAIAQNSKFKYSRLFAIGLFTLLETVDAAIVKEEAPRTAAIQSIAAALNLPEEKIQKDLELYRSNLEKMNQVRIVMEDTLKADRKKRDEREKAKVAAAEATLPVVIQDETSSGS
jgi:photosystem II biogenesis protein Psp29